MAHHGFVARVRSLFNHRIFIVPEKKMAWIDDFLIPIRWSISSNSNIFSREHFRFVRFCSTRLNQPVLVNTKRINIVMLKCEIKCISIT